MTALVVGGCRITSLGGYLTGLGLLRAVTRLLDSDATGGWQDGGFVLHSRFGTLDDLAGELFAAFRPEPIVSPWNAGSGFAGRGSAADVLQWVRESDDQRLGGVKEAVAAADKVVAIGRDRGWGGTGNEMWDKAHKRKVFALCRNEFPDAALPWLDAAVALAQDNDVAFSRLLGTGGNFGRQDLSFTYLSRLRQVWLEKRGHAWLRSLLSGEESVPYLRDAVGQFDPGRAGGIQSSPWEKGDEKGFVNPWSFLLTVEGCLLFGSAVVRRHGAGFADAALPFQVRGSTSGHGSAAADESPLGELWAPEWSSPARLAEVRHLLAEGRARWNERPARSALDFVRAIGTLGVDRGITAFHRYVFVDRLGQNPLAVSAGRIAVGQERRGVRQLAALDGWLDPLSHSALPGLVAARVRGLEQALFAHARSGSPADLAEVFAALGQCHEAVGRSGSLRGKVRPLVLRDGPELARELAVGASDDVELRIALALATARDEQTKVPPTMNGLRPLFAPVKAEQNHVEWSRRPALISLMGGLGNALVEAAHRRAMAPGWETGEGEPAVKGVRIAFANGFYLSSGGIRGLASGEIDQARIGHLLAGLLTVDWHGTNDSRLRGASWPDPALDLLALFSSAAPVSFIGEDGRHEMLLRPAASWPAQLGAGRTSDVLADAARRLRIGSHLRVISPAAPVHVAHLAARLLLPAQVEDLRHSALPAVTDLTSPCTTDTEEIPV
jgi:CRISPR-associated protein Csx17